MKIDLPWTAAIAELRSMKSSAETKIAGVTEIVKATIIIFSFKKGLLKAVTVLSLTGAALAAAII